MNEALFNLGSYEVGYRHLTTNILMSQGKKKNKENKTNK